MPEGGWNTGWQERQVMIGECVVALLFLSIFRNEQTKQRVARGVAAVRHGGTLWIGDQSLYFLGDIP
jgi:hypothetical protein